MYSKLFKLFIVFSLLTFGGESFASATEEEVLETRSTIKAVCTYCAASVLEDDQMDMAERYGKMLAENEKKLVYGGGAVGMMGQIAKGCLAGGGEVHGIIPEFMMEREWGNKDIQRLEVVETMHIRKFRMHQEADGFVILPGGFGSLDELFEMASWKQLSMHSKPIVVLNYKGFWDPLAALLDSLVAGKSLSARDRSLVSFVTEVDEVIPALNIMLEETFKK